MMNAILSFFNDACSPKLCSRGAMVGVICLTFWATAHSADSRVRATETRGSETALSVAIDAVRAEQTRVREELEKTRKELRESNAEQTRKLERLEDLLTSILIEARKRG